MKGWFFFCCAQGIIISLSLLWITKHFISLNQFFEFIRSFTILWRYIWMKFLWLSVKCRFYFLIVCFWIDIKNIVIILCQITCKIFIERSNVLGSFQSVIGEEKSKLPLPNDEHHLRKSRFEDNLRNETADKEAMSSLG